MPVIRFQLACFNFRVSVTISMQIFWLKSRKWKHDDLDGKLVEFHVKYPTFTAEGIGQFVMRGNGVERLAADIIVPHQREGFDNYYHLDDALFEKIEINPDKTKAEFRVNGSLELTA